MIVAVAFFLFGARVLRCDDVRVSSKLATAARTRNAADRTWGAAWFTFERVLQDIVSKNHYPYPREREGDPGQHADPRKRAYQGGRRCWYMYVYTSIAGMAGIVAAATQLVLLIYSYL